MIRIIGLTAVILFAGLAAAQELPPAPPSAALAPEAPAPPAPVAQPAPAPFIQAAPAPPAAPAVAPVPPVPPVPPVDFYAMGKGSYLGIGVQEVDSERAKELKLPEERGVEVTTVSQDSPAAKAGLKEGDVVLEYNGEKVEGVEQFVRIVRETPPGRQAKLLISRNGATQTITATVGNRKHFFEPKFDENMKKFNEEMKNYGEEMKRQFGPGSKFQMEIQREFGPDSQFNKDLQKELGPGSDFQKEMQKLQQDLGRMHVELYAPDTPEGPMGWRNRALGVEAESVSAQLAEFFGVKQGVLVRAVNKDSAAEKAGIKAGDVIVKMGGDEVDRPSEVTRHIREAQEGKPVAVTVVRNKKQMVLNVTPQRPASSEGPQRIRRRVVAPEQHFMPQGPGRLVSNPEEF